jgi:hypothetical protein
MRNLRLLALVAPAFFLPLACEDAGSSSGGAFSFEAGPGFEAGPVPEGGGPLPEAGVDSSMPPPPAGVTITVTDGIAPKKDVRVLLHDAAGIPNDDKKTDAAGTVTFALSQPMVTVLAELGGGRPSPVTFMGVADGDKLVVVVPSSILIEQAPFATYNVTWNANDAVAGSAATFDGVAGNGCTGAVNAPATAMPISLFPNCLQAKNAVLAAARKGQLIGFGFAKDVPMPAMGTNTGVGPLTFALPGSTTQTVSNFGVASAGPSTELYAIANGAGFKMDTFTGSATDVAGAAYKTPVGFAEAYQQAVYFGSSSQAGFNNRGFLRREAPPANGKLTTVDFATALPSITNAAATSTTPNRPDVAITSASPLTATDGGIVKLNWFPPGLDFEATWTFVVPSSMTTFKAPAVPSDASVFVPPANATVGNVIFVEATQLPGYAELKKLPVSTAFTPFQLLDTSTPLPAAGTVRITTFGGG